MPRRCYQPLLVVCQAVLLIVVADPAHTAKKKGRGEAKRHFARAEKHFKLGKFEEALSEYTTAFERFPAPGFLFNIGQCHRNLGNLDRSIFFFQSYLREKPDAHDRLRVERLIESLKEQQEKQEKEEDEAEQGGKTGPPNQEEPKTEELPVAPEPPPALRPEATVPVVEPVPIHEQTWFWLVAGSVAAIIAGGTVAVVGGGSEPDVHGSIGTIDAR